MSKETVSTLRTRAQAAEDLDEALLHDAAEVLREVFPGAPAHPELLSDPVEAVLHVIDRCLPGWTISLKGRAAEPDGHWHCSLREGDMDNDRVIGSGDAPTVSLALLRALLVVASYYGDR